MYILQRGMIILVNLEPTKGSETGKTRPCVVVTNNTYNMRVPIIQVVPITEWSDKKAKILTNVVLEPTDENGLSKRSVADCLQTRPIDYAERLVSVLGMLSEEDITNIDNALKVVFQLD